MSEYEYSYTPKREDNKLKLLTGSFFFASVLLFAPVTVFTLPYEWLIELAAFVFLTTAILLLTRFVFKKFVYHVKLTESGSYDLTVDEVTSRSTVTVCRVSLSNIERVELLNEENSDELRSEAKKRKRFSYLPDLFVSKGSDCFVFVTECGEPLLLRLSVDNRLYAILKRYEKESFEE